MNKSTMVISLSKISLGETKKIIFNEKGCFLSIEKDGGRQIQNTTFLSAVSGGAISMVPRMMLPAMAEQDIDKSILDDIISGQISPFILWVEGGKLYCQFKHIEGSEFKYNGLKLKEEDISGFIDMFSSMVAK